MTRSLRIAHLTPTFFSESSVIGGGERYVHNLAKSIQLASKSNDFAIQQDIISVGARAESFKQNGIEVHVLKNSSPFPNAMDAIPTELRNLLDSLKGLDLIHIHQNLTLFGAYATAIAKSKNIPIVSTDLGGGENDFMLYGKGLELCDGILSISEYAKSLINANFSGNHCSLIGPVDTNKFTVNLEVSRKKNTAICVGRILPHKGFDLAIRALPKEMKLLIIGRPYDLEYLKVLKSLSKGKSVEFINNANDSDLVHLYQTSSTFIQPSAHKDYFGNTHQKPELMGLTTLEALSCGLPAIVSTAGSLPELVPNRNFGRTFEDVKELETILHEIVSNKWPRQNAGKLAREHVIKNHSFPSVGHSVLDFYRSILRKTKATALQLS